MKVTQRDIDSITPYDKNPRVNDDAVDKVAASLKEFGFRQPIVVDKEGVVIVGHTRLKAAKQLGMTKVPVHVADLKPEQARAYRVADNQTATLAGWDDELLYQEMLDIKDDGTDLDLLGFSDDEIAELLGHDDDENEPPEPAMPEIFQVVVECNNENHQRRVFDILEKEGIECRVLTL